MAGSDPAPPSEEVLGALRAAMEQAEKEGNVSLSWDAIAQLARVPRSTAYRAKELRARWKRLVAKGATFEADESPKRKASNETKRALYAKLRLMATFLAAAQETIDMKDRQIAALEKDLGGRSKIVTLRS